MSEPSPVDGWRSVSAVVCPGIETGEVLKIGLEVGCGRSTRSLAEVPADEVLRQSSRHTIVVSSW